MDNADLAGEILDRAMSGYRSPAPSTPARIIGRCCACGEDIEPARLRVMPFAVRCMACQSDIEVKR